MDCLVTKLKASVINNDLQKLGELSLEINSSENTATILGGDSITFSIRTTGTLYLYDATGTAFYGGIENCQEANNINGFNGVIKGNGKAYIKDNDKISRFTIVNDAIVKSTELMTRINTTLLALQKVKLLGSVADLAVLTKLTNLNINASSVVNTYDISVLAPLKELTNLVLGRYAIGTLESFVVGQVSAGRVSGTLSLADYNSLVTLNGVTNEQNVRKSIAYNANGAVISTNGSTVATYSNGTWAYS